MYKKVDPNTFTDFNTKEFGPPVLAMEDEYGGRVVVVIDDHCYLALQRTFKKPRARYASYFTQSHLFKELFRELKKLPMPR